MVGDIDNKKWYSVEDLYKENLIKCGRSNCVLDTSKMERYITVESSEYAIEETFKSFCVKKFEKGGK